MKKNYATTHKDNINSNEALSAQLVIIRDSILIQDLQLSTEKEVDRLELTSKFESYVWSKLSEHKRLVFPAESVEHIRKFIEYGVNEMFKGKVTEVEVIAAKQNLDKFVSKLLSNAIREEDDSWGAGLGKAEDETVEVTSYDFNEARAGVCHLYPFC